MLWACVPEMTDISSSCFSACVLLSFRNAICLFRAATRASQSDLSRVRPAVLLLQFFKSFCRAPYELLRLSYFDCKAFNFLLLVQANSIIGKRPVNAMSLIRILFYFLF